MRLNSEKCIIPFRCIRISFLKAWLVLGILLDMSSVQKIMILCPFLVAKNSYLTEKLVTSKLKTKLCYLKICILMVEIRLILQETYRLFKKRVNFPARVV